MFNYSLITGASTGIGKAFALEIANQKNSNIILVARRENLLEGLKKEIQDIWSSKDLKCVVLACDLTNLESRVKLIESCREYKVSNLINNAGYGSVIEFSKSDLNWELNMIELNCKALLHLTRHFGPIMADNYLKSGIRGKIINVSSVASFHAMPYMATYAATKAFVTSFSLAVDRENGFRGVDILALCPGPTESDFHLVSGLQEKMTTLPGMTAQKVVQQALNASKNGRSLYINGINNFIMAQLHRIFPKTVAAAIIGMVLKEQVGKKTNFSQGIDKR